MTLDKAIEVLEIELKEPSTCNYPDTKQATILLIEAGKRIQTIRSNPHLTGAYPLPSESK